MSTISKSSPSDFLLERGSALGIMEASKVRLKLSAESELKSMVLSRTIVSISSPPGELQTLLVKLLSLAVTKLASLLGEKVPEVDRSELLPESDRRELLALRQGEAHLLVLNLVDASCLGVPRMSLSLRSRAKSDTFNTFSESFTGTSSFSLLISSLE
uniref:Uncharacterized protein n=1 Tax=Cacopsylla melanoneura TaxID=428564 RepID=A0A8D8XIN7_9HEMI